ncbi:hypothetical protein CYY_000427 [Polysphondylium violaceum]|uniref:Carbohydrate binding domain-containing protein n=1 Tax=Polysphondylium violaceum TaxID=133409 RepID=A0A8J4Q4N5_9MYCE|nr:hypothetical protein CYY_000427 [Polysphondylium violaceum]
MKIYSIICFVFLSSILFSTVYGESKGAHCGGDSCPPYCIDKTFCLVITEYTDLSLSTKINETFYDQVNDVPVYRYLVTIKNKGTHQIKTLRMSFNHDKLKIINRLEWPIEHNELTLPYRVRIKPNQEYTSSFYIRGIDNPNFQLPRFHFDE